MHNGSGVQLLCPLVSRRERNSHLKPYTYVYIYTKRIVIVGVYISRGTRNSFPVVVLRFNYHPSTRSFGRGPATRSVRVFEENNVRRRAGDRFYRTATVKNNGNR